MLCDLQQGCTTRAGQVTLWQFTTDQVKVRSGGMVPRASAESGISQLNPPFPYRSCAKRLGEEGKEQNYSQKCGVMDRFLQGMEESQGWRGTAKCHRGKQKKSFSAF